MRLYKIICSSIVVAEVVAKTTSEAVKKWKEQNPQFITRVTARLA